MCYSSLHQDGDATANEVFTRNCVLFLNAFGFSSREEILCNYRTVSCLYYVVLSALFTRPFGYAVRRLANVHVVG